MPEHLIAHYRVLKKLGSGGMGEVYLAEDTKLDRKLALKLLLGEFTNSEDRLRRFIQEAKAASALNHPNIITIYEIGQHDGTHFIATEFIKGETLRQHILLATLSMHEALDIAIQVASALAEAHKVGIVHRDIKPENIMLREDGIVKVVDFGLAKLTERQSPITDAEAPTVAKLTTDPGTVMGTVNYMSPEQARGKAVDARSDIFSLGVVLYEMLTGRSPFEAETISDTLSFILHKEPLPLIRYSPGVPAELERIVTKSLAKNKEERCQTAKDLLIDLKRLKQRLEVEAEIERSISPDFLSKSPAPTGSGAGAALATSTQPATPVGQSTTPAMSSVEYLVSKIKRNQKAAAVLLVVLLLGSVGFYFLFKSSASEEADSLQPKALTSLAVLPFTNASADTNAEFLSDGISESLINRLSQLSQLKVMARTTSFQYKGRDTDPQTVGRELKVDVVLTGKVLQRGDSLLVQADLVKTSDGSQLWGERYNRKMSDVLAVQDEIATQITEKLSLRLTGEQQKLLARQYTSNTDAYQLYLKGRFYWNKRADEALKKSVEYFSRAIEHDPNFALAYSGLADAHLVQPVYSSVSSHDAIPKAKAAAKRAMEIDGTLAEAHATLAVALLHYDWNLAESEKEFQRAIELNPNYAPAHQWYGIWFLPVTGRFDEAIAELKRALEIDPLSLIINTNLGEAYIFARQYDKAVEQLRKTVELDQSFYRARRSLGVAYELKGFFQEAIAEYQEARQLNDDSRVLALLAHALATSGKRSEALRMLDQLKESAKRRYVPPYDFAIIYAGLGEKDQAFQWLERGCQERDSQMVRLKVDPLLDSLRADPRLTDLMHKIGLTP